MTTALTKDMVLSKSKADKLNAVANLNLWGNDIEDISLLSQMPNIQIVSLSLNKISSLKDFSCCSKISELYLRKNCISELTEVQYLKKLTHLKNLWLS